MQARVKSRNARGVRRNGDVDGTSTVLRVANRSSHHAWSVHGRSEPVVARAEPLVMNVVGQQPVDVSGAARCGVEVLHAPGVIALLVVVHVSPARVDEIWALMVHVTVKCAVDSTARGVEKRFLDAVAVDASVARDPKQPLVRVPCCRVYIQKSERVSAADDVSVGQKQIAPCLELPQVQ